MQPWQAKEVSPGMSVMPRLWMGAPATSNTSGSSIQPKSKL
ncbi:hypothetical protein [Cupriavidus sp. AcVe19-1a]|nr:hypothetical protein [Cupriavidus sp. AcVe19-1a]